MLAETVICTLPVQLACQSTVVQESSAAGWSGLRLKQRQGMQPWSCTTVHSCHYDAKPSRIFSLFPHPIPLIFQPTAGENRGASVGTVNVTAVGLVKTNHRLPRRWCLEESPRCTCCGVPRRAVPAATAANTRADRPVRATAHRLRAMGTEFRLL